MNLIIIKNHFIVQFFAHQQRFLLLCFGLFAGAEFIIVKVNTFMNVNQGYCKLEI